MGGALEGPPVTAPLRRFTHRFTVRAPVDRVTEFHFGPGAFEALAPPLMPMRVSVREPLADGSRLVFTTWAPLPVRWVAVHEAVDAAAATFTDVQVEGPLAAWSHRHTWRAVADGTEVIDEVHYAFRPGLAGLTGRLMFNPPALVVLFRWRAFATRRALRA